MSISTAAGQPLPQTLPGASATTTAITEITVLLEHWLVPGFVWMTQFILPIVHPVDIHEA